MPKPNSKVKTTKAAPAAKARAPQPQNDPVAKMVTGIFSKIQTKTGLSSEKIDKFQKDWLAMPANRKKYEHMTDAPVVAIEEGIAMANDILDYLEGQEGGKSMLFKSLKAEARELAAHPVDYLKGKFEKAEGLARNFMNKIQKK